MKVRIKTVHAVAAWRWDLPPNSDDTCGICQNEFDATCPNCKYPGDDCPLQTGRCKHTFHFHCVEKWLGQDSSQGNCPMCRQPFQIHDTPSRAASVPTAPAPQIQGTGGPQIPPPQQAPQTPAHRQTIVQAEGPRTAMDSPPEATALGESSDDRETSEEEEEEAEVLEEDSDEEVENNDGMEID